MHKCNPTTTPICQKENDRTYLEQNKTINKSQKTQKATKCACTHL